MSASVVRRWLVAVWIACAGLLWGEGNQKGFQRTGKVGCEYKRVACCRCFNARAAACAG